MKSERAFLKFWHVVRPTKLLVVLGVALYDALRAMQFSHEGELQLAIYSLLWGVAAAAVHGERHPYHVGARMVQVSSAQNGVCSWRIC